jgi:hypothetical protein
MSAAIGVLAGALTGAQLLIGNQRSIGPYLPTVTIEEHLRDKLTITKKPVEYGAAISDHSYKEPSEFSMRVGWSDSGIAGIIDGSITAIYADLLNLQVSGQFFTVVTGKRVYQNVLLAQIGNLTDVESENALMLDLDFEQVIVVNVSSTTIAPQQQQANPAQTSPVIPAGAQTPVAPPNQSILYSMFGGPK